MRGFGDRLRQSRQAADFDDAAAIAHELGIDSARYRKYERGESMPPIEILLAIVDLTGVDLHWLFAGKFPRP